MKFWKNLKYKREQEQYRTWIRNYQDWIVAYSYWLDVTKKEAENDTTTTNRKNA